MKIVFLIIAFTFAISNIRAQDNPKTQTENDSEELGLPGDNLDLYAVLSLFQESKTIEEFEETLNEEKAGINNLDLNLDDKVDFIKVSTKQEGTDFTFVLQVDVIKDEIQDVAVILVSKDENKKVSIQIVGNEDLYGKDYIIEPKAKTPSVTANPAYSGPDTVVVENKTTTVVVLESEPIIQYVYSPVYVPYYPPYYYGYYPPYYAPRPVISFHIYASRHHHHHHHYHGGGHHGRGNTVVINNRRTYNNYNKTRKTSTTVNRNNNNQSYKRNRNTIQQPNNNRTNNSRNTRSSNASNRSTPNRGTQKPANSRVQKTPSPNRSAPKSSTQRRPPNRSAPKSTNRGGGTRQPRRR